METEIIDKSYEKDVEKLVGQADILISNTISNINKEKLELYFNIGKMIVEYKEKSDSKHGDSVVKCLSGKLYMKYGTGFEWRNIFRMIQFYEMLSKVAPARQSSKQKLSVPTLLGKTTWSHVIEILKVKTIDEFEFYLNEVNNKNLNMFELRNYVKSRTFERKISNQNTGKVKHEIENTLMDPTILGIENKKRSEKELEDEIMLNISNFKKEMGPVVTFYERQYKLNINGLTHRVDLVFFDNDLLYYILIDLKIKKVTNKDVFQMKMYVDYFNKYMKKDNFNKTVGIILCETKDLRVETLDDIYQVKYLNEIPKDKELLRIINENKVILLKTEDYRKKEI